MDIVNNQDYKHTGALIQLKAYGASDIFLTKINGEPMSYNIRNSLKYWFIENNDGLPTKNQLSTTVSHK